METAGKAEPGTDLGRVSRDHPMDTVDGKTQHFSVQEETALSLLPKEAL